MATQREGRRVRRSSSASVCCPDGTRIFKKMIRVESKGKTEMFMETISRQMYLAQGFNPVFVVAEDVSRTVRPNIRS